MKKVIYKVFEGFSREKDLAMFMNENNIQQIDVLTVHFSPHPHPGIHLFYYVDK